MTIAAEYSADTYNGNGATTSFAITFPYLSDTGYIKVSTKVVATGVITERTLTTDYTFSGSNVVFVTAPASGTQVIIEFESDNLQSSDYDENGPLPAETLELDLDKKTLELQQLRSQVENMVKFDPSITGIDAVIEASSTLATNANKYLKMNDDGTALELFTLSTSAGLGNVVEDTSPQLGNNLDLNSSDITGTGDINITGTLAVSSTAATGALTVTGNIAVSGTVDGRDVATDGTKLDGIEALADVTDEANVKAAIDGAVYTAVTVASTDKVLIQDVSDSDNLKTVTAQSIADLNPAGVTASSVATFTNKTIDADGTGNVITNIGSSEVKSELITGVATVTAALGDLVHIADVSDSNNLKNVTVQTITDLSPVTLTNTATLTNKTLTSPVLTTPRITTSINDANGNEVIVTPATASAINEVTITNAAAGTGPSISATGDDSTIQLNLKGKGFAGLVNIVDDPDPTKRAGFDISGATTGTRSVLTFSQSANRTITFPNASDTLVGKATTDVFTNKTVTDCKETVATPTVTAGAVTLALSNGTMQKVVTAANTTITLPSAVAGTSYTVIVQYGGAHTITWAGGGTLKWAGGAAPTATSSSGKYDIYVFVCHDATNTFGSDGGRNY